MSLLGMQLIFVIQITITGKTNRDMKNTLAVISMVLYLLYEDNIEYNERTLFYQSLWNNS